MYWWYWCLRSNPSFRHPTYPRVILKIQQGKKCQAFYISSFALWGLGGDSSLLTIHSQRTPHHSVAYLSFSNPHLFRENVVWAGREPGEKDGPEECCSKPQRSAPPSGTIFLCLSFCLLLCFCEKLVFSPETALNLVSPGDWTGNSNWHPIEPDEAAVIWLLRNT